MLDTIKVWWVILTQIGPAGRVQRQGNLWIRYFVIEALNQEGLFNYLLESRNYGQIVAEFGFVDSRYTREVFETLSSGRNSQLIGKDGRYYLNPAVPLPSFDEIARRMPKVMRSISFFRDFAQLIPARMRQEPIEFVHRFEEEGPALFSFDKSLSTKLYSGLRNAAFAFINEKELRGKRLLNVGCGSGYETAEIWLRFKGDIKLTAVDPAIGLLNLARDQFSEIVSQSSRRGLPSLTEANRPSFHLMSAMNLEFPDESFNAVYHSVILHWLPDPQRGIREMARVLKPGGWVFGTQFTKPVASAYMNLIIQVHESVHGFFWGEEFKKWYERAGVPVSVITPAGVFKGRKIEHRTFSLHLENNQQ